MIHVYRSLFRRQVFCLRITYTQIKNTKQKANTIARQCLTNSYNIFIPQVIFDLMFKMVFLNIIEVVRFIFLSEYVLPFVFV